MGYWFSLQGTTAFPSVVSTCTNYFSFLLQWIASLPIIITRTFFSLYYTFLTLRSGQLAFQVKEVLYREGDQDSDRITQSSQPTDLQPLSLTLHLIWIAQTEELKPNTTGTFVFCHTSYHSLRGTNSAQYPTEQLLLKAHAIYPQQVPRNSGQTGASSSKNAPPTQSGAPQKRKANGAPSGRFKARKPRGNDNEDDNPNPRDPNHREDLDDQVVADTEKYFACHFFKLNPRKYHRCASKQLKTLDNLKQHIKRNHFSTYLHCRCCWEEFGDDQLALRNHASGDCEQRQGPDTLYQEDERLLETERGSSPREKWYEIWGKICEGHEAPDSPYTDPNTTDELGRLIEREIQSRMLAPAQLDSVCNRFQYQVPPELTRRIVNTLINETFSHPTLFQNRHRRKFNPINVAQPTVNHQATADDDGGRQAVLPRSPSPSDFLPAPESYEDLLHLDPALFDN
ncbi:hypothetical protein QBC37DRAFT_69679 [Rhypophila decipiens]|uniref:C2H2-type domain-containing protein n=1 Tax=Rhypophila decipiens TaxID=261697 RepID=A0AAN6Y1V3_9PEZI|nr:hypothetical protein QBC37DRAFT_69679 [Rhypophila decipiens]